MALPTWLTKAGNVTDFISETVMVGFKAGVAFYLASTQLPKLFGFKGTHGDFWDRMGYFLRHLSETNTIALALGVGSLVLLLSGKYLLPNRPVTIGVLIGGIVLATVYQLGARGVSVLGEVPQGLPAPALPEPVRRPREVAGSARLPQRAKRQVPTPPRRALCLGLLDHDFLQRHHSATALDQETATESGVSLRDLDSGERGCGSNVSSSS